MLATWRRVVAFARHHDLCDERYELFDNTWAVYTSDAAGMPRDIREMCIELLYLLLMWSMHRMTSEGVESAQVLNAKLLERRKSYVHETMRYVHSTSPFCHLAFRCICDLLYLFAPTGLMARSDLKHLAYVPSAQTTKQLTTALEEVAFRDPELQLDTTKSMTQQAGIEQEYQRRGMVNCSVSDSLPDRCVILGACLLQASAERHSAHKSARECGALLCALFQRVRRHHEECARQGTFFSTEPLLRSSGIHHACRCVRSTKSPVRVCWRKHSSAATKSGVEATKMMYARIHFIS